MVDAQPMKILLLAALLVLVAAAPQTASGPDPPSPPGPPLSTGPTTRPPTSPPTDSSRPDMTSPTVLVGPRSVRADRRGRLTLTLLPRNEAGQVRVSLSLGAKVGGRTLVVGGGSYRVPGSRATRVSVRLTSAGAAALRRVRRLTVAAAARATDAAGLRRTSKATIRVRAAARR